MKKLLKPMELLTHIANQTSEILQRLEDIETKKSTSKTNDFHIDTILVQFWNNCKYGSNMNPYNQGYKENIAN